MKLLYIFNLFQFYFRAICFLGIFISLLILAGCIDNNETQEVPSRVNSNVSSTPASTVQTIGQPDIETPTSIAVIQPTTEPTPTREAPLGSEDFDLPLKPPATETNIPPTATPTPPTPTPTPFIESGFVIHQGGISDNRHILVTQPGTERQQLIQGGYFGGNALSPDGTKLIIDTRTSTTEQRSPEQVKLLNLNTGEISSINLLAAPFSRIYWSPDGESLLYLPYGTEKDQLVSYDLSSGTNDILIEMDSIITTGGWSFDGSSVAFIAEKDNQYDIFAFDITTRSLNQLTFTRDPEIMLRWSPVNDELLFGSSPYSEDIFVESYPDLAQNLYLLNTVDLSKQHLGEYVIDWNSVSWAPDGHQIGFSDAGRLCIKDLNSMQDNCPIDNIPPYNGYVVLNPMHWIKDGEWLIFQATGHQPSGLCVSIYYYNFETESVIQGDPDICSVGPVYWSPIPFPNWIKTNSTSN